MRRLTLHPRVRALALGVLLLLVLAGAAAGPAHAQSLPKEKAPPKSCWYASEEFKHGETKWMWTGKDFVKKICNNGEWVKALDAPPDLPPAAKLCTLDGKRYSPGADVVKDGKLYGCDYDGSWIIIIDEDM
jgi:hypothetical protein